jgi:hypothetical protein
LFVFHLSRPHIFDSICFSFFPPYSSFIVVSFVPVPHDLHSKTGFPGRRHTEQADTCCPWWWCISVCWRERETQSGCHDSIFGFLDSSILSSYLFFSFSSSSSSF